MDRHSKGKYGELLAQQYYEKMGYTIIQKNYRYKRAEIDFIAQHGDMLLVFVEVKHRSRRDYGEAETFVSFQQKERIQMAAESYIYDINWKKNIRFDIVCVNGEGKIEIFEDAF